MSDKLCQIYAQSIRIPIIINHEHYTIQNICRNKTGRQLVIETMKIVYITYRITNSFDTSMDSTHNLGQHQKKVVFYSSHEQFSSLEI